MIYIGTTVLGYPEREVWHMTPRKLIALHTEHQKYNNRYQEKPDVDDIIPGGL